MRRCKMIHTFSGLKEILGLADKVIQSVQSEKRGRKRLVGPGRKREYDPAFFVLLMIVKGLFGVSNNRLARLLNRGDIPLPERYRSYKPTRKTLDRNLCLSCKEVRSFWERFVKALVSLVGGGGIVIVDSTSIEASTRRDRYARSGRTTVGWFFGYKGHILIVASGFPVASFASTGNVHDSRFLLKMAAKARRMFRRRIYLLGDGAYDGEELFMGLVQMDVEPFVALNPHRSKDSPYTPRTPMRRRVAESLANPFNEPLKAIRRRVEQFNAFLKGFLRAGKLPWWVRGVRRTGEFLRNAMAAALAVMFTNMWNANPLMGWN